MYAYGILLMAFVVLNVYVNYNVNTNKSRYCFIVTEQWKVKTAVYGIISARETRSVNARNPGTNLMRVTFNKSNN